MRYNKKRNHRRFLRTSCKLFKTKKVDQIWLNGHHEHDELLKVHFIATFIFYLNMVKSITNESVFSKHMPTDQYISRNNFKLWFELKKFNDIFQHTKDLHVFQGLKRVYK